MVHQMCNPVSLFKPNEGCWSLNRRSVWQLQWGSSRIISWKLHATEFVSSNGISWLQLTCTHWKATTRIEDFVGRCRGVISKNWWCWWWRWWHWAGINCCGYNGSQPFVSFSVKSCRNKSTTQLQLQYPWLTFVWFSRQKYLKTKVQYFLSIYLVLSYSCTLH
jgi:hypothetical protein